MLEEMQEKKARNDANNANTVKNAAAVAKNSGHPVASAIGTGVEIADKISGGKASEKLGKKMTTLSKMSPGGRRLQKLSNFAAESGLGDRIGSAMQAKNGQMQKGSGAAANKSGGGISSNKTGTLPVKNSIGSSAQSTLSDESNDGGGVNFTVSKKVLKRFAFASIPFFAAIIFCCLFVSATQVIGNSISLGTADSLSSRDAEEKINKKTENSPDDFDNEITDEDAETAFISDKYITEGIYQVYKNNQLNNNVVQVANNLFFKKRKYNEATLDQLEDFYPSIVNEKKNYDERMVYDFYFKMYNLFIIYRDGYNVYLDLPLLMATLNLQSTDKNVIFSSNMDSRYRTDSVNDIPKDELDYYFNWSNYIISRNNSEHDMEILAQNMVSKQVKEICADSSGKTVNEKILRDDEIGNQTLTCEDGENYKTQDLGYVVDNKKYKEFLKEFLEKKYYLDSSYSGNVSGSGTLSAGESYTDGTSTMAPGIVLNNEPDPSTAINYWKNYVNPTNFIYPKDPTTGLSLGAWPKDYASIPTQLENVKQYQNAYIWPTTPADGIYTYVYEHNGMDIMAVFGTPIYSPVNGILDYSTWGHTTNRGSDETAYTVSIIPDIKLEYGGTTIDRIFLTHMSGIRYRCDNTNECNRKVRQGELVGFVGNAAGSASSVGWAPHLHLTYYNISDYGTGLRTSTLEKFYNIKSNTRRKAGE